MHEGTVDEITCKLRTLNDHIDLVISDLKSLNARLEAIYSDKKAAPVLDAQEVAAEVKVGGTD